MIDPAFVLTRTMGILFLSACAATPLGPGQQRVANGQWGGDHIGMEVTDEGAQLEFDCAHGRIPAALVLAESGTFDARGTYVVERPGPRREDDDNARAVRYTGRVEGTSMSLSIRAVEGASDPIASYTLQHGRAPVVRKCH